MWWLLGLLGVLGAVVMYQLRPTATASSTVAPSNPKEAASAAGTLQVTEVNLDRLHEGTAALGAAKRDPFRFKPKPPPPPPPRVAPPPPLVQPIIRPPGPPPDPRPAIQMKYLGYVLSSNGTRLAILQDNPNRSPLYGKQGDIIDGKYRLLRVDAGEIEMSYLDGAQRRRIVKGQ
jgi:hypothetical protein